jgi:hypothetical protein
MGEVLIGYLVITSHRRLIQEHRVDDKVLKTMGVEVHLGILALGLVVIGFVLEALAQLGWA